MSQMIEINLLPEELKTKLKAKKTGAGFRGLKPGYFLYIIPLIFGILICAHIYLSAATIIGNNRLRALNNKWRQREPQKKALESFHKEYAVFSEYTAALQKVVGGRINWAEKLNRLSLDLPSGVWFNELSFSEGNFILQGAVVSLEKQEMALIKSFIDSLKNDPAFFDGFDNLELSSMQDKTMGGYNIVVFTLQGALKK